MSDTSTPPNDAPSWGKFVLVVVLLVPLAAVAWVAWLQAGLQSELAALRADNAALQQLSQTSSTQFTQMQQRQQELDTEVQQTLQQELAMANTAVAGQAERLAALESELAETRLRISAMDAGGAPLAEADVLLRFAQQRLSLARDTTTAIELFGEADTLLRNIDDPALVVVRETLAREVAQLQALPVVDVPGLFAQLSAQAARIETFDVVSMSTQGASPAVAEATDASGWWSSVKQSLGEYFVVTHSTGEFLPQLDAGEQFQLRALVQLHIEQAKLALLRAEPELYRAALNDALATTKRWLRSDDGSVDDLVAALETLRDTPIVTAIPATDQTLAALRQLSVTAVPESQP